MTDTKLLEQAIKASGRTKTYLAEKIGLSLAGFRNCAVNKAEFKASQIQALCVLLDIKDPAQKEAIFFAQLGD